MRVGRCCRTKEAAEKALVEMNEATVGQWKIRCGWAHHKTEAVTGLDAETVDRADPANTNVYVGNLASEVRLVRRACLVADRQLPLSIVSAFLLCFPIIDAVKSIFTAGHKVYFNGLASTTSFSLRITIATHVSFACHL